MSNANIKIVTFFKISLFLQWNIGHLKSFFKIFTRVRNLMLHPASEWKEIAAENNSRKTVYMRFVLPWLCLIAIATIIGTWLATSRELYSVWFVLYMIVLLWASISAGLYVSAVVITEIMAHQSGTGDLNRDFTLIAYASGAAYLVIAFVALFPFFNELLILAFYSCYLFWRGIPYIIRIDDQKQMIYGLLSFIIILLVHLLMFFLFGKLFGAILL